MGLLKSIIRSRIATDMIGRLGARYLDFVQISNRFSYDPPDPYTDHTIDMPAIVAMWHGQHFMVHYARRPGDRFASLISRSADGGLAASILTRLGVRPIRGSGARGRNQKSKGGALALREMIRALAGGESVVMTADVPKTSRICGLGIVMLARLSGRPIVPIAVVTSRRIDFGSWDRASLGLPFGRGAMVFGQPLTVPPDCDAAGLERYRAAVEASLDDVHARAYRMVGSSDPGEKPNPDKIQKKENSD